MSKSFKVPANVRKEAQKGLDLRKEHSRGGLSTKEAGEIGIGSGVQRAVNLVQGSVPYETIKRMLAFFNRHKAYKKYHKAEPPTNSYISWLLWGGDAGYSWVKKIVKEQENVKKGSFLALSLFGDDYPSDQPLTFSSLVQQAQEQEQGLELTAEDAQRLHETDPLVFTPRVEVTDDVASTVKKALKVRKKGNNSKARKLALAIRRNHLDKLDLSLIESCLDGIGTDDEDAVLDGLLVGGVAMIESLEKAIPEKYLQGLKGKERKQREKEIEARKESDKVDYSPLAGDEDAETKPSKYTKTQIASKIRAEIKEQGKDEFIRASAKVSGVSKKILEQVYDRGLKAWATSGHRVGATAQQWAKARVYSFLSGGKTTKTADKDLFKLTKEK